MQPVIPYLTFPGTCAEAMKFYAEVLGGEITIMVTLADSPLDVPAEAGEFIFNSELRAGELVIKASDNPADIGSEGESGDASVSLFVTFADEAERKGVFDRLAEGGQVLFPLDGPFGMVRDRFGTGWMLTLPH